MDKGKAIMGSGRRWAVEFTDNSASPSSRDIPDPPGFTRSSHDQVRFLYLFISVYVVYILLSGFYLFIDFIDGIVLLSLIG